MTHDEKTKQLNAAFDGARKALKETGCFQVVYRQIQDDSYVFCPEWVWDVFAQFGYPKSEFYALVTY